MQWELADYDCHPINGEASQIEACATHLGNVAGDLRAQISQLQAINAGEIWISAAGAHEAFQDVIDDLPDQLDLVAIRYEKVNDALASFHPTLASNKTTAEYNIEQAALAQSEVERAETGIELIEDFEAQAKRDADAYNEANPDCASREPEQWSGEDYHATLAAAQEDLRRYVARVKDAVTSFENAAEQAEQAIRDAINDDLKNSSGWFDWVPSWDDILDALEVVVKVLGVIAAILSIVVMIVALVATAPVWLVALAVTAAALVFIGTFILWQNDRATGWDMAWATIGLLTAGLGVGGSGLAAFFTGFGGGLAAFDLGTTLGNLIFGADVSVGNILERAYEGARSIDLPDLSRVGGPLLRPDLIGGPIGIPRPGGGLTGLGGARGLDLVMAPVARSSEITMPPTVALPPNAGGPVTVQPPPAIAGEIPQIAVVVDVSLPSGIAG